MAESEVPLSEMCRGNGHDQGWEQTSSGNWVPSVWDRRRLGTAEMLAVAEHMGIPGIPGPLVPAVLARHSTDPEDFKALLANFSDWARK